jgi:hypothetical protein
MEAFADAGVDLTKDLNYSLEPLAAVAMFKSFVSRFRALVKTGDLDKNDVAKLSAAISEAELILRGIEGESRRPGPRVGIAGAAAAAWSAAAVLAADDVTGVGIADDIAIPFVIIGASVLSAVAIMSGGPKPQVLEYGPAKTKVNAALRQMTDLLNISEAVHIQGRARPASSATSQCTSPASSQSRLSAASRPASHRRRTTGTTSTGGARSRPRSQTSSRPPRARRESR